MHSVKSIFCVLIAAFWNFQTVGQVYPTYASGAGVPAVYNGLEVIQTIDAAIVGVPSSTDIIFICLSSIPTGTQISFGEFGMQGNGLKTGGAKIGTYTFGADAVRGTLVKAGETTNEILTPGAAAWTASGSFAASGGFGLTLNTVGDFLVLFNGNSTNQAEANVIDYIAVTSAGAASSPPTAWEAITGGYNSNGVVPVGDYFVNPGNLNSVYGLGWPGFLEARRAPENWTGTTEPSVADYNGYTVVCPASEVLYSLYGSTLSSLGDDFLNAANADASVSSMVFDTDVPSNLNFNLSGDTPFNQSVEFANGFAFNAGSTKRFGGSEVKNTGGISWPQGRMILQGSNAQTATGFSDLDLIEVGSAGATLESNGGNGRVALNPGGRMVTTGNVTIAASDTLVLGSDASGTAGIGQQTGTISGNVTVERFIGGTELGVGNGFSNGGTEVSWVNIGNLLPGTTAGDILGQLPAAANVALYKYNNADRTYTVLTGTDPLSSPWDPVPSYDGYFLLLPSNAAGYTLKLNSASVTIPADATLNIDLLTGGVGWNLLVNPFASPISVTQLFTDNPEIKTVGIYGGANNLYNVTDRDGVSADIDFIDVGQGFWVNSLNTVSGSPITSLTITPAAKTSSNTTFIRETNEAIQGVAAISAYEEAAPDLKATSYISFRSDASIGLDPSDIYYSSSMTSARFEIWTTALNDEGESVKLLTQSAGDMTHSNGIPLVVETKIGGEVSFVLEEHDLMTDLACARIVDNVTGDSFQLSFDEPVTLNVEPNTTYTDRFILDFSALPGHEITTGFCSGGLVDLDVSLSGVPTSVILTNTLTGDVVADDLSDMHALDVGTYELSVETNEGCQAIHAVEIESKCLGEVTGNGMRDVQDLMTILSFIGSEVDSYDEIDAIGADCDCDETMTNMDILTFLTVFGLDCD